MASGSLGNTLLTANANTVVYTVPTGKVSTFNLNCVNANISPTTIRISISNTSTPAQTEYIEYNTVLSSFSVLERTGLVASGDKNIVVFSTAGDVTVNVYGFED